MTLIAAQHSLADIARRLGGELVGEGTRRVSHLAALQDATPDSLCYLADPRYLEQLGSRRPGGLLIAPDLADEYPGDKILVADPRLAYAKISPLFAPEVEPTGIHPSAVIDPKAALSPTVQVGAHSVIGAHSRLGERVRIGANVSIGERVEIGPGSVIESNVTLHSLCRIGRDCIIQSGCVIGATGFGYAWDKEAGCWQRIEHFGGVQIGDNVEIGAGCTIDRGALGDTKLGDGVKLDDQVMLAHNVEIGAHTIIAGCCAIAGSTKVGSHCQFGGCVAVNGHVELADHVVLTGRATVTHSIPSPGLYSSTLSARPARQWRGSLAVLNRLPELLQRVRRLERAQGDDTPA